MKNNTKKILIIGAGKSGIAAEKLLKSQADCFIWDDKMPEEKRPSVSDFDELVMSPGVPLTHPMALEAKQLKTRISGELEIAYENCDGEFVAITGTNGKTTTTSLVGEIYKAAGYDTRVVGNIGNPVSEEVMSTDKNSKLITEVSSFQLETVDKFHAHISALLNITPDHLNRHKTFENYAEIKSKVCINQTANDYFVYNEEDPECQKIIKRMKESGNEIPKLVPFSSKKNLPFKIEKINIPGDHNMQNALAAAAICSCAGISKDIILDVISKFDGVEHRMEFVRELAGVRYINDSKGTNPDSTIKAVSSYAGNIILIAGGYEKNSDFTELINSFDGKVKLILTLGATGPRFREKAIELGFNRDSIVQCESMDECVAKAHELSESGDTVLLSPACASWGMYNNFEERGKHFKDLVKAL